MKKAFLMVCAALVAFAACNKQAEEIPAEKNQVVFHLDARHPEDAGAATKAVKTAWEAGDVIFVFIAGQTAPAYLELKYDGSSWINTGKGLAPMSDGTRAMRAVYLPYGSDAEVQAESGNYVFSKTAFSYYLSAYQEFTVADGVVTGTFDMQFADGFVQFYYEKEGVTPTEGGSTLSVSYVTPTALTGLASNLSLNTFCRPEGAAMPGQVFGDGYQYSGVVRADKRNVSETYTLKLAVGEDYRKADGNKKMCCTDEADPEYPGRAYNLSGVSSWTTDAMPALVDMGLSVKWMNMNFGATAEGEIGDYYAWGELETYYVVGSSPIQWKPGKDQAYTWYSYRWDGFPLEKYTGPTGDGLSTLETEDDLVQVMVGAGWRLPSKTECQELADTKSNTDDYEWRWCNGSTEQYDGSTVPGWEIKWKTTGATIFFPAAGFRLIKGLNFADGYGFYWSSDVSEADSKEAYDFEFNLPTLTEEPRVDDVSRYAGLTVRGVR